MSTPLPPVDQKFYEENRKRFEAETHSVDITNLNKGCSHFFVRKSPTDVGCKLCPVGWIDGGRFIIENGKLIGIK